MTARFLNSTAARDIKPGDKIECFGDLFTGDVLKESEELSVHKHEGFRVLDRRLQALRKKGLIANISSSKGWVKL